MPVTIQSASHPAKPVRYQFTFDTASAENSIERYSRKYSITQSSFSSKSREKGFASRDNGFISTVIDAYNSHHHLILRPEDFWFQILAQFALHVDRNAEDLRYHFVDHEGKVELKLIYPGEGPRYRFDFSRFAKHMGQYLQNHVKDQGIREWIMPGFSTSTEEDEVIASIIMMGTLKNYFDYTCSVECGIPTVKLLGEKADYELLLKKVEKLAEFGTEPAFFSKLLQPIIKRLISCFDDPSSTEVVDFWQKVFSHQSQGSGFDYWTGWITAFCYWNSTGKTNYELNNETMRTDHVEGGGGWGDLCLNGMRYQKVRESGGPGVVKAPFKFIEADGEEIEMEMAAGSIGIAISGSGAKDADGRGMFDTIAPEVGWWVYEKPVADA